MERHKSRKRISINSGRASGLIKMKPIIHRTKNAITAMIHKDSLTMIRIQFVFSRSSIRKGIKVHLIVRFLVWGFVMLLTLV